MVALKLMILVAVVATVFAQQQQQQQQQQTNKPRKPTAETIEENSAVRADGYNFDFKTSDGVSRTEEAKLITVGEHQGIGVQGSYSYTAPDGQQYMVSFTADDKGYKPTIRIVPQQ